MKLSNFLSNMITTGTVEIEANQLREYAQQVNKCKSLVTRQCTLINEMQDKIDRLKMKVARLQDEAESKELQEPLVVDLFA